MLQSAIEGQASLRFYGWTEATVSLGYFQPQAKRLEEPLIAELPFVRRASGGDALVHHHEVTYALALPPGRDWQSKQPWQRMHSIIASALSTFGVDAMPTHVEQPSVPFQDVLCFEHVTNGDLIVNVGQQRLKIVGSAQRKSRGAILQHGGILLSQSEYTPTLPGIRELSGEELSASVLKDRITEALFVQTGWQLLDERWSDSETRQIQEIRVRKYNSEAWNYKR